MYSDLKKSLKEERIYVSKKLKECLADDSPPEHEVDYPEYWNGRLVEIEIVFNFINY